MYIKPLK